MAEGASPEAEVRSRVAPRPFAELLEERVRATGSRVCLGIDPRSEEHPLTAGVHDPHARAARVTAFYRAVLAGAAEHVACVKPQSAFFEALGVPGLEAMTELIAEARALGLPVIVDAKRGDVPATAEAYASAYLGDGPLSGDALTVSPYLGFDALAPFVRAANAGGKGLFVLVVTSNPGAEQLQDLRVADGRTVHEHVADWIASQQPAWASPHGYGPIGAVVGATRPERLRALRARMPAAPILVPGYGAQGATADDVVDAFDERGQGAVVSSSRGLVPTSAHRDLGSVEREVSALAQTMAAAIASALERRPA